MLKCLVCNGAIFVCAMLKFYKAYSFAVFFYISFHKSFQLLHFPLFLLIKWSQCDGLSFLMFGMFAFETFRFKILAVISVCKMMSYCLVSFDNVIYLAFCENK